MAFELSQAYVSLTNEGFDQTLISTDGVEASLRKLMAGADAATDSVDSGLVSAMADAAKGMIDTVDATEKASDSLSSTKAVVADLKNQMEKLSEKLAVNVDDDQLREAAAMLDVIRETLNNLSDKELTILAESPEKLKSARDLLSSMIEVLSNADSRGKEVAETLNQIGQEAEKTAESASKIGLWELELNPKTKEKVSELNAELDKTKKGADAAANSIKKMGAETGKWELDLNPEKNEDSLRELFEKARGDLDSLKEKTENFVESLGKGNGKFASMLRGAARLGGLIGIAASAAQQVYSWALKLTEEWSGFNDENKRALDLLDKVGRQQKRITADAIRDANRLKSSKETLIALEAKLAIARRDNDAKQKTKREKEEALTPGTFGQFADGKVNSELVPEFERAKKSAEASQESFDMLASEVRRLKIAGKDFKLGVTRDLERAKILANEGEEALRVFDLVAKGFTETQARIQASEEQQLRTQEEKKQAGLALAENYRQQLAALELNTIELTKGKEAAAQARDIAAGFTPEQQKQLAIAREQNAEARKAAEAKKESERAAEEELRRQESVRKSFAAQANALAAKNIALQKGNEAAERFKNEAKGFTEAERESLAILRARNKALSDLDAAKKKEKQLTDKASDDRSGNFVNFAELAKSSTQDNELKQAQKETARATAALAKQAASEGIKIKQLATSAPRVDRRFGRGAAENVYKKRRDA